MTALSCQQSHCPCQNILYWKYFINITVHIFAHNIAGIILPAVDCRANHTTPASGIQCHGFCHSRARVVVVDHCSTDWVPLFLPLRQIAQWADYREGEPSRQFEVVIATIVICKCLGICLPSPGLILVFKLTSIKYLQACQALSVYYLPAMSFSNSDGLKTNNTR